MGFSLPVDVTVQRKPLSATSFEYIFRHHSFGKLGRLVFASSHGGMVVTPVLFAPAGDARMRSSVIVKAIRISRAG